MPFRRFTLQDGYTPLHVASVNGHAAAVGALLADTRTCVNAVDRTGRTPLHYAAGKGHIAVATLLLAAPDIDVNMADLVRPLLACSWELPACALRGTVTAHPSLAQEAYTPLDLALRLHSVDLAALLEADPRVRRTP